MHMNSTMLIGVVLIVIGMIAVAYQGITYTSREKILDVGPIEATAEKQKTIPVPPITWRRRTSRRAADGFRRRQKELVLCRR